MFLQISAEKWGALWWFQNGMRFDGLMMESTFFQCRLGRVDQLRVTVVVYKKLEDDNYAWGAFGFFLNLVI
jgi:hypothetical protein